MATPPDITSKHRKPTAWKVNRQCERTTISLTPGFGRVSGLAWQKHGLATVSHDQRQAKVGMCFLGCQREVTNHRLRPPATCKTPI